MLPLTGITVVDLSRALAGPYCTTMLADLGADVVKVEAAAGGDPSRAWPPFDGDRSLYFDSVNRNKRSVALDLYTDAGRQVLLRLLAAADVVVENFKHGTMERMGFGPEVLAGANPDLIHLSINAYGDAGPLRDRPGLDQVIQAVSGLTSVTGPEEGPGYRVGIPVIDITSGMTGAFAVVAALLGRERGHGARTVSTSLFETALALSAFQGQQAISTGTAPRAQGNRHPSIAPYGSFPTATEPVVVAVTTQKHWAAFCGILSRPEWLGDPRFADGQARTAHRDELEPLVAGALQGRPAAEWIDAFAAAGIPSGPIHDYRQAVESEQARALGMVREVERADGSTLRLLRGPVSVAGEPTPVRSAPPALGEHTREVLAAAGIAADELDALERDGVDGARRLAAAAGGAR